MKQVNLSDKKRILYVDGYEDNRLLMVYVLQHLGYECLAVPTMIEGLALARTERFDLYILDSWYADGTGVELCRRIRKFDQSTPILFFSAWTPDAAREEALRAGAIAYLLKPALDDVLLEIRRLLAEAKPRAGFLMPPSSASPAALGPGEPRGSDSIGLIF